MVDIAHIVMEKLKTQAWDFYKKLTLLHKKNKLLFIKTGININVKVVYF